MRRLVTGVDNQGRSSVISEAEVAFAVRHGIVSTEQLFTTDELPPPPRPVGRSDKLDLGVQRGLAWFVVRWEAGSDWPAHRTDTIDLDVVLDGDIELLLDDGGHHLEPGDSVVVNGVDHAWRAGPDGCTMCVTAIATRP
jgi:quercetin dioxygenase-like cupin family protein